MDFCKNCGRPIRVQIFRGEDWCSDDCRKILLSRTKCYYMDEDWDPVTFELIPICQVHGQESKYGRNRGMDRPCLAVEPWGY